MDLNVLTSTNAPLEIITVMRLVMCIEIIFAIVLSMRYVQTLSEVIPVNVVLVIPAMEKLARISTSVLTDLTIVIRFDKIFFSLSLKSYSVLWNMHKYNRQLFV